MTFLLVFIGGGLGSLVRYMIGLLLQKTTPSLPLATFAANTLQSGIYRLYVRVSLRDKPALGVHYLPVNMVGESNPILVFDAI